jgi:hypothetical protein
MSAEYAEGGIRFRYPENWKLEREDTDTGWSVLVQSPETAFFMLTMDEDMPSIEQMAETAVAALREEYPDLEAEDSVESIAGQPAVGHDIQFFSFDLTNTCWTRSFYTSTGTVLVLCQTNDMELAVNEPVLRAICASVELEDD